MKYYLDTEFLEGPQKTFWGKTKPTVDLISIGIVSEDNREYYAVSKDFNLKEAWNRFDLKPNKMYPMGPFELKEYWIRNNVLKPIFNELYSLAIYDPAYIKKHPYSIGTGFTYRNFKNLVKYYGKTNRQIANDIVEFVYGKSSNQDGLSPLEEAQMYKPNPHIEKPKFHAYYADYDWVAFCWLFGRMIDLPKGFPMYCVDLKQELDRKIEKFGEQIAITLGDIKQHPSYPKQENEHNALADARWNLELHKFINKL